jgi:hypothetical protein
MGLLIRGALTLGTLGAVFWAGQGSAPETTPEKPSTDQFLFRMSLILGIAASAITVWPFIKKRI